MKYWRLQINNGIESITDVVMPAQYHMACVYQFVMLLMLLMHLIALTSRSTTRLALSLCCTCVQHTSAYVSIRQVLRVV